MSIHILHVFGARPQFIKVAPLTRALEIGGFKQTLIHTGQHYDESMSDIFFRELGIRAPDQNLNVGSGSHAFQTSKMLVGLEAIFQERCPDCVITYGDTNSTIAAALAASKIHVKVAHIEAGLRSFNRRMPEEINRVLTDHLSSHLFCPSDTAREHLRIEGIVEGVHVVGDVMADALLQASARADASTVLSMHNLEVGGYFLATLHRAENTDDPRRLSSILEALSQIGVPILFPIHPRTKKAIDSFKLRVPKNILITAPLGYLDLVRALRDAALLLTDSGGLQKEAYWLQTRCLTLRDETEWTETVESGWNRLVGADSERIVAAANDFPQPVTHPVLYNGDGRASERITKILQASLG